MEIKRKTEITVAATRRFTVRQPESAARIFCPACGEQMLAAETAAAFFQINCRAVYRLVEAGAAHFAETETGATFVCPSSLAAVLTGGGGGADSDNGGDIKQLPERANGDK